jgi:hydroxymethylglutaryl-CoA synthase
LARLDSARVQIVRTTGKEEAMIGIQSFGAYVPRYRLRRDEIAKALGVRSQGGERAVCNFDEDSLTLCMEALTDAIREIDPNTIDGLFVASTTFPYKEKSASSLLAAALDLKKRLLTADFSDSIRCGTTAMRTAIDSIAAGSARSVLVAAADTRGADPESDLMQLFGDASVAVLLGDGEPAVTIENSYFLAEEFTDYWRKSDDRYVQFDDPAFANRYGFVKTTRSAIEGILSEVSAAPASFNRVVYNAPDPRSHQEIVKAFGFDPKTQVQDTLFQSVGNAGCAAALLNLVAVLQESHEGERILFANYGDGCDVFILRVQSGIEQIQGRIRGVKGYLTHRKEMDFKKFMSFRKLIK